jgi:hypothetical protein
MNPVPKIREPIIYGLMAAFLGSLAWSIEVMAIWLRTFLILASVWFLAAGLATAINWVRHQNSDRIRERNKAKVAAEEAMALALKGLTPQQTKMVAGHDVINIIGTTNNDGVVWNIKTANGENIPWEFMADFLKQSLETPRDERAPFGYLWPVREHQVFDWPNSEDLCANVTDLLVHSPKGFARKSAGPYPAVLEQPVELIAAYFGVEIG